jgi:ribonuclease E
MTRQRVRPSVKKAVYEDCPCCSGRGVVKTAESMSIDVVRQIMLACDNGKVEKVTVKVHQVVADYLKSKKKKDVARLEERGKMSVKISAKDDVYPEYLDLLCRDKNGKTIVLD